eukprot:7376378-Prymnesium_polylepis.1
MIVVVRLEELATPGEPRSDAVGRPQSRVHHNVAARKGQRELLLQHAPPHPRALKPSACAHDVHRAEAVHRTAGHAAADDSDAQRLAVRRFGAFRIA